MLSPKRLFSIGMMLLLFHVVDVHAQFYILETKYLKLIYYSKTHEYIVPHLARCFHNSLNFHSKLFHYHPTQKITIFLQDFSDYGYGGAESVPRNQIIMGMEPFSRVYETNPANERMNWTMNHELVHIVASDKSAGMDNFFRKLFAGKVSPTKENPLTIFYSYLTNPRRFSPRWYHEGIAVFLETWMAGGLGRVLGGYDEMVFRTMVRDNAYFYDIVGLESEGTTIDFQMGAVAYLYGTRFMSYLALQYGPQKLIQWTSRDPGSKRYFASQFKKIYGVALDDEWRKWIVWEHAWQKANLDSIRKNPVTQYRVISKRALGSVSKAFYDTKRNKLYAAVLYPGENAHLAAIDINSGKIEKLCEVKGAALYYVTSLTYDPQTQTIFYVTDNNQWRDLNALDLKTKHTHKLMKDVRVGDLAFNPKDRSLWGVRHFNGITTLVRIPPPYKKWNQIHSFDYGNIIFDLDISPDGSLLTASLVDISGNQKLIQFEIEKLMNDGATYKVLFDFEDSAPESFTFSPDGKYLFGSSYYTGVSNIYRYDFTKNDMEIISNCETGFFRPVPISEDSLIVMNYTGKGFVPVMIANQAVDKVSAIRFLGQAIVEKHPIVKNWVVGSPSRIKLDSLTVYRGSYSTFGNIKLVSMYPVVEGYKDFAAAGLRFNLADALNVTGVDLTASYSPDRDLPADERLHLALKFHYWQWELRATYNRADFYDLFGPTKTSRKGYSVGLRYRKSLVYERPKSVELSFAVAGYWNLERLPDYQNVIATFDKLLAVTLGLNYKHPIATMGAVDYEKGIKWQIFSHTNVVRKDIFPQIFANLDYGIKLPIEHSSVWLRSSVGQAFGDRNDPFANFFFGGFGNNWVDHLHEKRYREFYSFPGVELNEVGGKNFGKAMLEWNLPPIRFRRVGFPAFYFNWARTAIFTSVLRTNLDKPEFRRTLTNVGGQIDFRLVLFSNLVSTFSLGYAVAFEENQPTDTEFMFSLKILR